MNLVEQNEYLSLVYGTGVIILGVIVAIYCAVLAFILKPKKHRLMIASLICLWFLSAFTYEINTKYRDGKLANITEDNFDRSFVSLVHQVGDSCYILINNGMVFKTDDLPLVSTNYLIKYKYLKGKYFIQDDKGDIYSAQLVL